MDKKYLVISSAVSVVLLLLGLFNVGGLGMSLALSLIIAVVMAGWALCLLAKTRNDADRLHLLEQILFSSPDPALVVRNGHCIFCNPAAAKILGAKDITEVMNAKPGAYSPERQPDGRLNADVMREAGECVDRDGFARLETWHQRKSGELFPLEVTLVRLDALEDRPMSVFWRDIRETLRLREEKQQATAALVGKLEANVFSVVDALSDSAHQLEGTARHMSGVADATEQQTTQVTSGTRDVAESVQFVASAAEELSATIHEISRQVTQSSDISLKTSHEAESLSGTVSGLLDSASRIGEVVQLINAIAARTNLLALNASIEAARAGESGKGFAVVANEVKSLANQTASATEDIGVQISAVQSATRETATAIEGIVARIGETRQIAAAIAAAVEQQSAATSEIAKNAQQVASGTRQVSSAIDAVSQLAADTGSAAGNVLDSAHTLSAEASQLKGVVENFIADVRESRG